MPRLSLGSKDRKAFKLLMGGGGNYLSRLKATSPIAIWPKNEGSGTLITDLSGNGFDGTSTGWTWDGTQFVKGGAVPFSDGINDFGNVYSAGLASAFDFSTGCLLQWIKMDSASVWTDGVFRFMARFLRDTANKVEINRGTASNQLRLIFSTGGVLKQYLHPLSTADWFSAMISWDVPSDELIFRVNGIQVVATITGLGVPSGSGLGANTTALGSNSGVSALSVHHGYLAYTTLWNTPEDAAKIALGV